MHDFSLDQSTQNPREWHRTLWTHVKICQHFSIVIIIVIETLLDYNYVLFVKSTKLLRLLSQQEEQPEVELAIWDQLVIKQVRI